MLTHARSRALFISLLVALVAPGCFVFDEALYLNRDGGGATDMDASLDAGQGDAGDDGAIASDGGPPTLALADDCNGDVPVLALAAGTTSIMRAIDTTGLSDDYGNLGCTGRPQDGPEGFFAIDMTAGERWHVHVRRRGTGADPVLFVLRGMCNDLACDRPYGLDACRVDSDEHLSLVATSTGRYFVGIDSGNAEGFAGSVEVFRPACGDGALQHGEGCEPGVDPTLTCSADCRAVLSGAASEHEVNDDAFMANELTITPGTTMNVGGRIGALCENDVYAIDVPAGGSVAASLLTAAGGACPSGTPEAELQLLATDGIVVRGSGTVRGASTCPSIDATDTFATGLAAGRYYLRIYALNDAIARPFDYLLRIDVTAP